MQTDFHQESKRMVCLTNINDLTQKFPSLQSCLTQDCWYFLPPRPGRRHVRGGGAAAATALLVTLIIRCLHTGPNVLVAENALYHSGSCTVAPLYDSADICMESYRLPE